MPVMTTLTAARVEHRWIDADGLAGLLAHLRTKGYRLVGPRLDDTSIGLGDLDGADDLPTGWTDEQAPGRYRVHRRDDHARFGYAVPSQTFKQVLFPPRAAMWRTDGHEFIPAVPAPSKLALIGVRPCELAAIVKQDRVLQGRQHADPTYVANRRDAVIIAVHCGEPASTCFCTSMATGPHAPDDAGYDLALTEVVEGGEPWYLVDVGSAMGAELTDAVGARAAQVGEIRAAERVVTDAAARITKRLDTTGLRESLHAASDDTAGWSAVGDRCLTCGNCTLVCPTCFCTTVEDSTGFDGTAERARMWDTCFSLDFSKLAGGPVRPSAAARYRQWITHKLASWHDQFGESGCVGCGRCTTWCPVGIDLPVEAATAAARSRARIAVTAASIHAGGS
jgi:sulfhydrogenase subunit beta (sulfur reductase)